MQATLDYGRRQDSPWPRASRLIVRILIGCAILFIAYIAVIIAVMTPWGREFTTPRVEQLVRDETGIALPKSFTQTGRDIRGGIDPAGYFTGRIAAADVATFVSTLERSLMLRDISQDAVRPIEPPPRWWTPAAWPQRRTFERGGPPNLTVIHVDPTTGEIAVEWVTT